MTVQDGKWTFPLDSVHQVAPTAFGYWGVEDGKAMLASLVVHPVRLTACRSPYEPENHRVSWLCQDSLGFLELYLNLFPSLFCRVWRESLSIISYGSF